MRARAPSALELLLAQLARAALRDPECAVSCARRLLVHVLRVRFVRVERNMRIHLMRKWDLLRRPELLCWDKQQSQRVSLLKQVQRLLRQWQCCAV
jgi:hypothetical protein